MSTSSVARGRRLAGPLAPLLGAVLLLGGCGSGNDATGAVTTVAVADRGAPISFSGTGLDGKTIDLSTYRGKPMVINVWGAWCGPCVAEADVLAQASRTAGVPFLGIDIEDNVSSATAFNAVHHITYPSVSDPGGQTLLKFVDYPVRSPPTTYVLDGEGRVAAVVTGEITDAAILTGLVDDVEEAGTASTGASAGSTPTTSSSPVTSDG